MHDSCFSTFSSSIKPFCKGSGLGAKSKSKNDLDFSRKDGLFSCACIYTWGCRIGIGFPTHFLLLSMALSNYRNTTYLNATTEHKFFLLSSSTTFSSSQLLIIRVNWCHIEIRSSSGQDFKSSYLVKTLFASRTAALQIIGRFSIEGTRSPYCSYIFLLD